MSTRNVVTGRDRFDLRPDVMHTLYEAALFLVTANLHRGGRRTKVYALYNDGYIPWERTNSGITNYDENVELERYEGSMLEFVETKLSEEDTIGFMAMDTGTFYNLLKMQKEKNMFNPRYLKNFGLAILQKHFEDEE